MRIGWFGSSASAASIKSPMVHTRSAMTGNIGVKEIERLIQKLEIDKEVLADQEAEKNEAAN